MSGLYIVRESWGKPNSGGCQYKGVGKLQTNQTNKRGASEEHQGNILKKTSTVARRQKVASLALSREDVLLIFVTHP